MGVSGASVLINYLIIFEPLPPVIDGLWQAVFIAAGIGEIIQLFLIDYGRPDIMGGIDHDNILRDGKKAIDARSIYVCMKTVQVVAL